MLAKTLGQIARYSQEKWGAAQAQKYIREVEECLSLLAKMPALGRGVASGKKGSRRFEQGQHVVFYREEKGGIFVRRILHSRMAARKHLT